MFHKQNNQTNSIKLCNSGNNVLNIKFPPIVTSQSDIFKQTNPSKQWKDLFVDPLQKSEIIDNRSSKEKLYDELKDNNMFKVKMSQSEMKKQKKMRL